MRSALQPEGSAESRYLDLLELALIGSLTSDPANDPWHEAVFDVGHRIGGLDWPRSAPTMVGLFRLRQLREAAETCLREGVPGDFIETGVWRGGACILLSGVLAIYGVHDRRVFVADSFEGLPAPKEHDDRLHAFSQLSVSLQDVVDNFARFALLNDRVVFVPGWFRDTLSTLPSQQLAVLRLDGDLYESTVDALTLYDKLSPGGFCIVDDYNTLAACRRAVDEFRVRRGIREPLVNIDTKSAYWRKGS